MSGYLYRSITIGVLSHIACYLSLRVPLLCASLYVCGLLLHIE